MTEPTREQIREIAVLRRQLRDLGEKVPNQWPTLQTRRDAEKQIYALHTRIAGLEDPMEIDTAWRELSEAFDRLSRVMPGKGTILLILVVIWYWVS